MAKHYKQTRVYNKKSYALEVGFLGDNGVTLGPAGSNTGYFDHPGELVNDLKPSERDALESLITNGYLEVVPIEGTTETSSVYREEVVLLEKSFNTAGSFAIFDEDCPTKLKIVDVWVHMTTPATRSAKDITTGVCTVGLTDGVVGAAGVTAITEPIDCGATAAPTAGLVVHDDVVIYADYATLERGDSLVATVTASSTAFPAGTVYVQAVKVA